MKQKKKSWEKKKEKLITKNVTRKIEGKQVEKRKTISKESYMK